MVGLATPHISLDLSGTPEHSCKLKKPSPGLKVPLNSPIKFRGSSHGSILGQLENKLRILSSHGAILNSSPTSTPRKNSAESYLKKLLPSTPHYSHRQPVVSLLDEAANIEEPPCLPSSYGLQSCQKNDEHMMSLSAKELGAIHATFETPLLDLEEAACEEEQILHEQRVQYPLLQSKQLNHNGLPTLVTDPTVIQSNFVDIEELIEYQKKRSLGGFGALTKTTGRGNLSDRNFVVLSAGALSNNPNNNSADSDVPICEEMLTSHPNSTPSERSQQFLYSNPASEDRTIAALSSSSGMQSDRESTAASEALLSLAGNSAPQQPLCVFVAHPQIFALPMEPPRMMGSNVQYMPQPWFPMPFGVAPPYAFGVPMPGSGPPLPPPAPSHSSVGLPPMRPNNAPLGGMLMRTASASSGAKMAPQSQGSLMLQPSQPLSPTVPGHSEGASSSSVRTETDDEDGHHPNDRLNPHAQAMKARLVRTKIPRHSEGDETNTEGHARKQRRLSGSESDSIDENDEFSDDEGELTVDHSNRALDRIMFKYPKIPPPELRGGGLSERPVPVSRDPFSRPDRVSVIKRNPRLESRARLHIKGVQQCGNNCPYEFATLIKMAEHLDREHPPEYRRWLCPDESCIWSLLGFHKKVECARHIKGQHSNVMYKCTHCRRQFARSDSYRRHFTTAHKTLLP